MNKKFKILIPVIAVIFLTTIIIMVSINKNTKKGTENEVAISKTEKTELINTTRKEVNITTETTRYAKATEKEETTIEEKIEEFKDTVTTTKSSNNNSSNSNNNSSSKTEVKETTTKKPTTTKPQTEPKTEVQTTETITSSPKNKFPEGHIVTSNPHFNESTKGDYWYWGTASYKWEQYKEGDEWYDMEGNKIEESGEWDIQWTQTTAYATQAQKERIKSILWSMDPPRDGKNDGEVYEMTIWVWLPN